MRLNGTCQDEGSEEIVPKFLILFLSCCPGPELPICGFPVLKEKVTPVSDIISRRFKYRAEVIPDAFGNIQIKSILTK